MGDKSGTTSSWNGLTAIEGEHLSRRFELLDAGRGGGMGTVFRARHRDLDRIVAIKVCHAGAIGERFRREALLAKLKSPHIVGVCDFDRLPTGREILVMDWIDGGDLSHAIRKGGEAVPESRALPWMQQVCEGMYAAAEQSIVHRDLKPSNILIDRRDHALVADFGLASSWDQPHLTQPGAVLGTPHYMAPEQIEDPRNADTRADVYSFGATFYHVLTGNPPFEAASPLEVLLKHKTEPLMSPQSRNPALSANIGECLERCMAKSPRDRFPTFKAVGEALGAGDDAGSPWNTSDDPAVAAFMRHYWRQRESFLNGDGRPITEVFRFPQGRSMTIQQGNIIDERVDAIVSSVDCWLSMSAGVSSAILEAAGPELRHETLKFGPVRPGRVVVTSGWALPARLIFHAVTMGYQDPLKDRTRKNWIRPSRDLLNEIMDHCFHHADTFSVETISVLLLGTGAGGFPHDVCLDTLVRSLASKLTRGATSVREARIVIYPVR